MGAESLSRVFASSPSVCLLGSFLLEVELCYSVADPWVCSLQGPGYQVPYG